MKKTDLETELAFYKDQLKKVQLYLVKYIEMQKHIDDYNDLQKRFDALQKRFYKYKKYKNK